MVYHKHKDLYFDTQHEIDMTIEVIGTDLTITPDMIEFEAFEMSESLCSESELKFGRCEANSVKLAVRGMPRSIKDEKIRIYEVIDGDVDNPFQYGIYKVYSDVPTADRTKRQITAYDAMYDILNADMKSWYASLSFPMTLKAFRDSFFTYLGIEQVETTLVNDKMIINKTLVATQTDSESTITEESAISGKLIIEAICEINGCFGNINRDGKFDYVILKSIISPLYPANDLYPSNDLFPRDTNTESMSGHYITFDYEDFKSKAITQLEIRTAEYSAGITAGENGNNYAITGNFLVSDKLKDELSIIAENTLSIIKKATYTPIKSSTCVGNPCLELGDPIRFNTSREIIVSYILQRTLKGIQCKRDSIASKGTETHSAKINSIKETLSNLSGRTNKLERTADRTLSEISDLDKSTTSRFEQTAEQIQSEITRATGAESSLQSRITQTAESITTEVENRQNADSNLSTRISQTAHSISLSASGGDNSVGIIIQLYDENGNLIDTDNGNANINIVGFVSFSDLAGEGTTTINGANITTGNINCDRLNGGTINGQTFYGGKIYSDDIVCGKTFYMHPGIGASGLGVSAFPAFGIDNLNRVQFVNDVVANITGSAFSSSFSNNASMATKFGSSSYYLYFTSSNNVVPNSSDIWCGTNSGPFKGGYSIDGWKTTSDERVKKDFISLSDDSRFETMFYLLNPTEYRLMADKDGVVHVGFTAQQVKSAMDTAGIQEDEFYGFHHEYVDMSEFESEEQYAAFLERNQGNNDTYSLCYEEFIALNTHMIQKQYQEIEFLKQENLALKNRLSILEMEMEELKNVINSKNN